jgi:hypothetical protein
MSEQILILTVRLLDENNRLTTITTSALPQSTLDEAINSFVISGEKRGQTLEGVECKLTFDPLADQTDFAETWNAIREDRSIPFSQKFGDLGLKYPTKTTHLYTTQRLKDFFHQRSHEMRQRNKDQGSL